MTQQIHVHYVGEDDWNRDVFQDEQGRFYKRYTDHEQPFYTADGFWAEPNWIVPEEFQIVVIEHE